MAIGGLDIGSTGAKVTVLDEHGLVLHSGYRDYPVSRYANAHEVDANLIWETVKGLLKDAVVHVPAFEAVGVTSFGESFVLLDENNRVLLPTMMYTDPRGEKQAERLGNVLGVEVIADISGTLPHSMFSLPKLMWVRDEHPAVYARVRRVCLIGDFVTYLLTGTHVIDYSLAARTMGFNIRYLTWSRSIFEAAGIDPALFGRPVSSGSIVGVVLPDLAAELGLQESFVVVLSGHDQIAAAVGSGVMEPGRAANGSGTVECVTPVFAGIPEGNRLQKSNYSVIPFLGNTNYCCYAFSFTGGNLVKWFLSEIASGPLTKANATGESVYTLLENGAPDSPTGILVLPHFAGAATPYMDTGSRGAVIGLGLSHTTADLYRAVMEGIAFEDAINIEKLAESGIQIEAVNASGGCARSGVWLQMKADILGIPVTRLSIEEAGTVGSIMFTGVAIGLYENLKSASDAMVKPIRTYTPRPEQHAAYLKHYTRYRKMYDAVRPLMDMD